MYGSADLIKEQRMVLAFYKGRVIWIQTVSENNTAQISLFTMHNSVMELTETGYHQAESQKDFKKGNGYSWDFVKVLKMPKAATMEVIKNNINNAGVGDTNIIGSCYRFKSEKENIRKTFYGNIVS